MVAIALAFGALTLGAPTQKAAASLAQKSPAQINLAAPFWESWGQDESDPLAGVDRSNEASEASSDPSTWTNSVDCPATKVTSGDADKIKEMMKKLTRKGYGDSGCLMQDPCDANDRKAGFECVDKDSSGTIDKSEMEAMLEAEGAPKEAADYMMGMFDVNGDGTLSEKEVNDVTVCMMACASK